MQFKINNFSVHILFPILFSRSVDNYVFFFLKEVFDIALFWMLFVCIGG